MLKRKILLFCEIRPFRNSGGFGTPPVLLEPSLLLTGVVTGRSQQLNALRNNHISCLSRRR